VTPRSLPRLASLSAAICAALAMAAVGVNAEDPPASAASVASSSPRTDAPDSPACAHLCTECEPGTEGALDLSCAAQALSCRGERTLCEAKLAAYRAQMDELASGVELFALAAPYRQMLARFYPKLELAALRFGVSHRQPLDNAVTDCDRIYFARSEFVERLRAGGLRTGSDWSWLLHELRHAEQCAILGGRDAYALRWLDELGLTLLSDADLGTLHDRIPMEDDADRHAERVLAELSACCRSADGRLRAPPEPVVAPPPARGRDGADPP
jgi:hypothetical protein